METLKTEIKRLAQEQKELKLQRTTNNVNVVRTMTSSTASMKHHFNRIRLRKLYMTLGILNGKQPEQVENNPKEPLNMSEIAKLVEQFKPAQPAVEAE